MSTAAVVSQPSSSSSPTATTFHQEEQQQHQEQKEEQEGVKFIRGVAVHDVKEDGDDHDFRNFSTFPTEAMKNRVENLYKEKYTKMTLSKCLELKKEYSRFDRAKMTIMDALEYLNTIVDESDPDADLAQINHALQTAEACRRAFPEPENDWIHLTGLIHDLGKVIASKRFGELPQYAVVGDIHPLGCAPDKSKNVLEHFLYELCPDLKNPEYSTKLGIYKENCGLDCIHLAYSHDEYLFRVLTNHKQNGHVMKLPDEALYIIRYHSFYAFHNPADTSKENKEPGYKYFLSEKDQKMLPVLRKFQKCDLYSKIDVEGQYDEVLGYYKGLIEKYIPGELAW